MAVATAAPFWPVELEDEEVHDALARCRRWLRSDRGHGPVQRVVKMASQEVGTA